jgi:predicted esterase
MKYYGLMKKAAISFEKMIPIVGTILLFKANVLLFILNQHLIDLVSLWASLTSSILLLIMYLNLKDLRISLRDYADKVATPKYVVIVNILFIAFLYLSFQDMVIVEYFPPVGAFESIIYALMTGYLLYILKFIIDSVKILLSVTSVRFSKQLYVLFTSFFLVHGFWIVMQPEFKFINPKNRLMVASLFVDVLPPAETFLNHRAYVLGTTDAPYGFLVYEPESVDSESKLPLLIFLHGGDETANSKEQHINLSKAAKHGPSRLIRKGQWDPATPMIVVSPQTTDGWWRPDMVHEFIEYLMNNYPVDRNRIYLTGLSRGGTGSFDYVNKFGHQSYVAAMVPLATDAIVRHSGDFTPDSFKDTPVWLFINDQDKYVPDYKATVEIIRKIDSNSNRARVTVYPKQGHDAWTETYTMTGQGYELAEYQPFNMDVFEWLLQHQKQPKK